MTLPYYVVWSAGPAVGDGTPSGSVHRDELEARRVARGREGALRFTYGPPGDATWRVWIDAVVQVREVACA